MKGWPTYCEGPAGRNDIESKNRHRPSEDCLDCPGSIERIGRASQGLPKESPSSLGRKITCDHHVDGIEHGDGRSDHTPGTSLP